MKRLLDQQASFDTSELALRELFASAEPYKPEPFRKRRVLVKVLGQQGRGRPRVLRGALIAVLLGATASAAAVGGGFVDELLSEPDAPPREKIAPVRPRPEPIRQPPAEAAIQPETDDVEPSAGPAEPAAAANRAAPRAPERPRRKAAEDATQVLDAVKALRAERDPGKAQGLLDDYMKSHPNGVLSEDALALSIEAAAARRDPKAKDYARRYLAKFPNGKYKALATRALSY